MASRYEAARALLWLGAKVAIAEIDTATGAAAADRLRAEMAGDHVRFVQTDVADEALNRLEDGLVAPHGAGAAATPPLARLAAFYDHLAGLPAATSRIPPSETRRSPWSPAGSRMSRV